jgi:hypothetical protein
MWSADITILSLPDKLLTRIFDFLSADLHTTGYHADDSLALASSCVRLNELYRLQYVTSLQLEALDAFAASFLPAGHAHPFETPASIARALSRFPAVTRLDLTSWRTRFADVIVALDGLLPPARAALISHVVVASGMTGIELGRFFEVCDAAGMRLESLDMSWSLAVGEIAMASLAGRSLSESLQKLSLTSTGVMDTEICRLMAGLRTLRQLDLSKCVHITDGALCSILVSEAATGLEILQLAGTALTDDTALTAFPPLMALTHLDVSETKLSPRALFSFPQALRDLDVSNTNVLSKHALNLSAFSNKRNAFPFLDRLTASSCAGLSDISFLKPVASHIRSVCFARNWWLDDSAAYTVALLSSLEEVNFLHCASVADETVKALASLRCLTVAELSGTGVSDEGVRALANGVGCYSLARLRLLDCSGVTSAGVQALVTGRARFGLRDFHLSAKAVGGGGGSQESTTTLTSILG